MVLEISAHDRLSLLHLGLWQSRSIMMGGHGGEKLLLSFLPDNLGGEERGRTQEEMERGRDNPSEAGACFLESRPLSAVLPTQHTDFGVFYVQIVIA